MNWDSECCTAAAPMESAGNSIAAEHATVVGHVPELIGLPQPRALASVHPPGIALASDNDAGAPSDWCAG
jgi:hypothetical protein